MCAINILHFSINFIEFVCSLALWIFTWFYYRSSLLDAVIHSATICQCILIFDAAAAPHRRPDHTSSYMSFELPQIDIELCSAWILSQRDFWRRLVSFACRSIAAAVAAHDNRANAQRTRCLPSQVMTFCDCNNSTGLWRCYDVIFSI